tara:strand:- start:99 stop:362 length:264 start_codon:yes stop_codon:yes gene_type:complete
MAEIDLIGVPWDEHLASIDDISEMKTGKVREERVSLIALMEEDRGFSASLEQATRRRDVFRRDIFRVSILDLWIEESSSKARMSELA